MTQWKKNELEVIDKFRNQIVEHHYQDIQNRLLNRDYNSIDFYRIASKQSLPKYLQKLQFKSIHVKQKETQKKIKIFKKQKHQKEELQIRKNLKDRGDLILLSEMYTVMSNVTQNDYHYNLNIKEQEEIRDLQQWQKSIFENEPKKQKWNAKQEQSDRKLVTENQNSMMTEEQRKVQQMHMVLEEMRNSKNYAHQVTLSLQTLSKLHIDQKNILIRTNLIEKNAKLIKFELDTKKLSVQKQLEEQSHKLQQKRKQYHNLFSNRTKVLLEQKDLIQQRAHQQDKSHSISMLVIKNDKRVQQVRARRIKIQSLLEQYRKQLEVLQIRAAELREQFKCLQFAELLYYRYSLKLGIDCRQGGLSWIIMELRKRGQKLSEQLLPNYLDKKSKQYLLNKTHHQQVLENLITQKFNFVKLIMKQTKKSCLKRISQLRGLRKPSLFTQLKQSNSGKYFEISKKNSRSSKLINKINEIQNEQILMESFMHKINRPLQQFTFQFQSVRNSKELYRLATNKLRNVYTKDFQHSKNDHQKTAIRQKNLNNYNNLLLKIKQQHIYLDDLDLQHQNHLMSHYKDNKDHFLEQAVGCFGVKKAYIMFPKTNNTIINY